ncbi:DMT family transporter [Streptomyces sp. H10-C2]|uniref:DMT family transporter n=1 Tax=unclassified Streptomyces TaxID=2593676 RepID=UPI0024B89C09|nr:MULTISPECIES: DMT family transporter [unclassified Streptomyces]MDJ0340102.1 DMT family transporter [Streptomyces sp. PH10-H1]MDJ0369261.1 DMT family transporter [Streptomyces sp. H10-C2]
MEHAPAATTATSRPARSPAGGGLVLAVVATVVWSGSFVAARALHDSVPPVQAAFWRWVIALVAVAPFAAGQAWRQRALLRRHFGYIMLAALLGVTVYNTLVNQAGVSTSASNMGMIMAAAPVLIAVFARQRVDGRRAVGLLIALAGVLTLLGKGSPAALLHLDFTIGDLWMLAAAASFAGYSALLRRKPVEIGQLPFLFAAFALGTLLLVPAYAVSLAVQGGFTPSAGTVGPLLYVGVCSSAVAFFAWNKAISLIGPARAGVVYYLQSVCVALLSFAVLGERTGPLQLLCMALILAGVGLGASGRVTARR